MGLTHDSRAEEGNRTGEISLRMEGGQVYSLTSALFGKFGLRAETHHVVFVQYKQQESSVMRVEEGVISGLLGAACAGGLYAI